MVTFVCYPKCTTCQRAKAWLDENGVEYAVRDIKTDNPKLDEIKAWHAMSGLPLKKFFNTSGLLYKSLSLKERLNDIDDDGQYDLLASDGMLVKRPIVVGEDFVLVGFKAEDWENKLR